MMQLYLVSLEDKQSTGLQRAEDGNVLVSPEISDRQINRNTMKHLQFERVVTHWSLSRWRLIWQYFWHALLPEERSTKINPLSQLPEDIIAEADHWYRSSSSKPFAVFYSDASLESHSTQKFSSKLLIRFSIRCASWNQTMKIFESPTESQQGSDNCSESLAIRRWQGRRFVCFTWTSLYLRNHFALSLWTTTVHMADLGTVERTPSTVVEPVSWCTNLKIENNARRELFESRALARSRRCKVPLSVIRRPTEQYQTAPKNVLTYCRLRSGIAVMRKGDVIRCYCPRFEIRFHEHWNGWSRG